MWHLPQHLHTSLYFRVHVHHSQKIKRIVCFCPNFPSGQATSFSI
jgi:hypothetical protein